MMSEGQKGLDRLRVIVKDGILSFGIAGLAASAGMVSVPTPHPVDIYTVQEMNDPLLPTNGKGLFESGRLSLLARASQQMARYDNNNSFEKLVRSIVNQLLEKSIEDALEGKRSASATPTPY